MNLQAGKLLDRIAGDYGVEASLPSEAVATVIARAHEFLEHTRGFLEKGP